MFVGGKDFSDGKFPSVRSRTGAKLSRIRFREKEVRMRLKKLDVSKANGPDGISARVLRQCAGALAKPLARLYSFFFKNGMPAGWKTANVVPVHKKKIVR